jgi:hypothetical protein
MATASKERARRASPSARMGGLIFDTVSAQ